MEVAGTRVHIGRTALTPLSVPLVNVTESMDTRSDLLDNLAQLLAPDLVATDGPVSEASRRSVGDEHVRVPGDELPFLTNRRTTVQVERPVEKPWLPGAAVEFYPSDHHCFVFEVDRVGQQTARLFRLLLETEVMVAGDHDPMLERQRAEVPIECPDLGDGSTFGEVAGVDQHVPFRELERVVQPMRVGNDHQSNFAHVESVHLRHLSIRSGQKGGYPRPMGERPAANRHLGLAIISVALILIAPCWLSCRERRQESATTSAETGARAEEATDDAGAPTVDAEASDSAVDGDETSDSDPAPTVDFLEFLPDETAWRRLAAPSNEHAVARTEVVKFVVDLEADRLYFCQSESWPIHHDFAQRFLSTPARPVTGDRGVFNRQNYLRPDRRFVMGSLVRYLDPNIWTVELGPADNLAGERIAQLVERLAPTVYFGSSLRYRPRSDLHRRLVGPVSGRLSIVASSDVMAGVRYQPLTLGVAFGYLRFITGELDASTIERNQIIVTREVPDDLPLCSALITSDLQTPLAHVAVLSHGRGTPDMALQGALNDQRLRGLDGRLVRLEVGPRNWSIEEANEGAAQAAWASRRPAEITLPAIDLDGRELQEICSVDLSDSVTVGAKAAQLGEACGLDETIHTPGGFVVPFAWFDAHLRSHRGNIDSMLQDESFRSELGTREARLRSLRETLEAATVDEDLIRLVRERIARLPRGRLIFRSSTNAEDLSGFSGAGLYRSVRVEAQPTDEQIADALRRVWASVWSMRAFEERDWHRIDHRRVAMAVIVQPFLEDIVAIGVAITCNPFSAARSGSFINVQPVGGSVTATGADVPEQILAYDHTLPEVLSRSSRNGRRPVLTRGDVRALQGVLRRLHEHFAPRWGGAHAVDVEFLLDRRRQPVVLQARPYRSCSAN